MSFREQFSKCANGEVQLAFLDSIDFEPYLVGKKVDVIELMRDIEDLYDYGYRHDRIPEGLQGCAFNIMDAEEFMHYLQERYPEWYGMEQSYTRTWYELRRRHGTDA